MFIHVYLDGSNIAVAHTFTGTVVPVVPSILVRVHISYVRTVRTVYFV